MSDNLFGDDDAPAEEPTPTPQRKSRPLRFSPPADDDPIWDQSMKPNPGGLPEECRGKRVAVQLANGSKPDPAPIANAVPPGWAADDKGGCRWSKTGSPFDIARYRVLG